MQHPSIPRDSSDRPPLTLPASGLVASGLLASGLLASALLGSGCVLVHDYGFDFGDQVAPDGGPSRVDSGVDSGPDTRIDAGPDASRPDSGPDAGPVRCETDVQCGPVGWGQCADGVCTRCTGQHQLIELTAAHETPQEYGDDVALDLYEIIDLPMALYIGSVHTPEGHRPFVHVNELSRNEAGPSFEWEELYRDETGVPLVTPSGVAARQISTTVVHVGYLAREGTTGDEVAATSRIHGSTPRTAPVTSPLPLGVFAGGLDPRFRWQDPLTRERGLDEGAWPTRYVWLAGGRVESARSPYFTDRRAVTIGSGRVTGASGSRGTWVVVSLEGDLAFWQATSDAPPTRVSRIDGDGVASLAYEGAAAGTYLLAYLDAAAGQIRVRRLTCGLECGFDPSSPADVSLPAPADALVRVVALPEGGAAVVYTELAGDRTRVSMVALSDALHPTTTGPVPIGLLAGTARGLDAATLDWANDETDAPFQHWHMVYAVATSSVDGSARANRLSRFGIRWRPEVCP